MKIGILGYGTIGRGVYEILIKQGIEVIKVFDLPSKRLEIGEPYTDNPEDIVGNSNIDIVIELLGGGTLAYELILKAICYKQHVVTANKEVIGTHFSELQKLASQYQVALLFEASVGGGIPIIDVLIKNKKVNQINQLFGILNGTTNYMLTRMQDDGLSFDESLKMAQAKGFAEADPTADLKGLDMVRKLAILASIAYDVDLDLQDISNKGIDDLPNSFLKYLSINKWVLKLMAHAEKIDNKLSLKVEPILVDKDSELAMIKNENNLIGFIGEYNDEIKISGKGAGRYPTACAVVTDVLNIIDNNYPCGYYHPQKLEIYKEELERYSYLVLMNSAINDKKFELVEDNCYLVRHVSPSYFEKYQKNLLYKALIWEEK